MKKIIALFSAVILLAGLTACNKQQTELSTNTLPTKVKVYGVAEYDTQSSKGTRTVAYSEPMDVLYRQDVSTGTKPSYSHMTITPSADGYFEFELGCPAGASLEVKVQGTVEDVTNGKTAIFFGTVSKTITCGSAGFLELKLAPVVYPNNPDEN